MGGVWQQSENPLRCEDCEHFEERISDICFICNGFLFNTPEYYIAHGNLCEDCNSEINNNLKEKKYENYKFKNVIVKR